MWKISLVDPITELTYTLPWDPVESLMAQSTATYAPIQYNEGFNFMGVLNGKVADTTMLALEQFIDRWKHCKIYKADDFAPTMGNVSKIVAQLLYFAQKRPEGIWVVEA